MTRTLCFDKIALASGENSEFSPKLLMRSRDTPDEDPDGFGVEECRCRADGGLRVLPVAAVSTDLGEEALDNPSPRLDGETDLIVLSLDDLDGDGGGLADARPLVALIGEDLTN